MQAALLVGRQQQLVAPLLQLTLAMAAVRGCWAVPMQVVVVLLIQQQQGVLQVLLVSAAMQARVLWLAVGVMQGQRQAQGQAWLLLLLVLMRRRRQLQNDCAGGLAAAGWQLLWPFCMSSSRSSIYRLVWNVEAVTPAASGFCGQQQLG